MTFTIVFFTVVFVAIFILAMIFGCLMIDERDKREKAMRLKKESENFWANVTIDSMIDRAHRILEHGPAELEKVALETLVAHADCYATWHEIYMQRIKDDDAPIWIKTRPVKYSEYARTFARERLAGFVGPVKLKIAS